MKKFLVASNILSLSLLVLSVLLTVPGCSDSILLPLNDDESLNNRPVVQNPENPKKQEPKKDEGIIELEIASSESIFELLPKSSDNLDPFDLNLVSHLEMRMMMEPLSV